MISETYRGIAVALTLGLTAACGIEYSEFPDEGGTPFVYGALSAHDTSFVIIQETRGYQQNVRGGAFVSDAVVNIVESLTQRHLGVMEEVEPGIYEWIGAGMMKAGAFYHVDIVTSEGSLIRSMPCEMPELISIDTAYMIIDEQDIVQQQVFSLEFICPAQDLLLRVGFRDVPVEPASGGLHYLTPRFGAVEPYTCANEGGLARAKGYYPWFYSVEVPADFFDAFRSFAVEMVHVSEEIYRIREDLDLVDYLEGGDELYEPLLLYSNVEGAFGVVGAYETSIYQLK